MMKERAEALPRACKKVEGPYGVSASHRLEGAPNSAASRADFVVQTRVTRRILSLQVTQIVTVRHQITTEKKKKKDARAK
jgi:hypothetical protein